MQNGGRPLVRDPALAQTLLFAARNDSSLSGTFCFSENLAALLQVSHFRKLAGFCGRDSLTVRQPADKFFYLRRMGRRELGT